MPSSVPCNERQPLALAASGQIASKRRFTYEHSYWLGRRQEGMADFVFPSAHPFNSLPLLRTAVAARNDPQAITRIFR